MAYRPVSTLRRLGSTCVIASLLVSCAGTQMTSSWRDPNYSGGPLKKIAIFVVQKDESRRRLVEDQVAGSFPAGAKAVPGYTMFPALEKDIENIKSKLAAEGFDGALIGSLAAIVMDETYRAPQLYTVGPGPFGTPSTGPLIDQYYQNAYSVAYDPGYRKEKAKYFIETVLYTLPEGKPVWKATSESVNPDSTNEVVAEVTRLVGRELQREKLVGTP